VTLAALRRGTCDYISPEQVEKYALYLSFTGGPTLRRLETEFGSPMARPLYCSVDPDLYKRSEESIVWDVGYLGTYSRDRQAALESRLLQPARRCLHRRFVVAGPQFPDSIGWPANVDRIVHLPPAAHPSFYSSQRFTLNLTRSAMVRAGYSPSVRLFEAAACATPIITDEWDGLSEFFEPGEEILISTSSEDTLRYVNDLPADVVVQVGARGRARVLRGHTSEHRALELESYVAELRRQRVA